MNACMYYMYKCMYACMCVCMYRCRCNPPFSSLCSPDDFTLEQGITGQYYSDTTFTTLTTTRTDSTINFNWAYGVPAPGLPADNFCVRWLAQLKPPLTGWYGMVWYGMVWYGMVWYGMVWYGMVWYGMVWYGMVWYGIWYGMVYGMVWYVMVLKFD